MSRRRRIRRRFRRWSQEIPWHLVGAGLFALFVVSFIGFLVAAVYE